MKEIFIGGIVLLLEFLFFILDCIVPRFMDTVMFMKASDKEGLDYEMFCLVDYALEDDEPDAVMGVKLFKWFGFVYIYNHGEIVVV